MGGPGQGELVEEEKRRQEAPQNGLQCQAWKHGVGEWDQREETGNTSQVGSSPLVKGSLVSKVNQISLLWRKLGENEAGGSWGDGSKKLQKSELRPTAGVAEPGR